MKLRSSTVAELDPVTLYRILQLRVEVFVVEQECAYPELDGRDVEPSCVLVWAEVDGAIVATLRVLSDEPRIARIGRVATAQQARSAGIAGQLMQHALDSIGPGVDVVLDAQSPLAGWYARFGFTLAGNEFIEDGIPHVPMRRAASA